MFCMPTEQEMQAEIADLKNQLRRSHELVLEGALKIESLEGVTSALGYTWEAATSELAKIRRWPAYQRLDAGDTDKIDKDWLPKPQERVVVRCNGFTCLAYRDSNGVWRADKHNDILPEVLEVLHRF